VTRSSHNFPVGFLFVLAAADGAFSLRAAPRPRLQGISNHEATRADFDRLSVA